MFTPRENFRHHPSPPRLPSHAFPVRHRRLSGSRIMALPPGSAPRQKPDGVHQTESFGSRSWRASLTTQQTQKFKSSDSALIRELALLARRNQSHRDRDRTRRLAGWGARNISIAASMPANFQAAASTAASGRRRRRRQASRRGCLPCATAIGPPNGRQAFHRRSALGVGRTNAADHRSVKDD